MPTNSADLPAPSPPSLRVYLLGQCRFVQDDVPIETLGTGRVQTLCAYLALQRAVAVPREQMAFTLWPDSGERQARTNLRQLLHALRRAWPDATAFLDLEGPELRWRRGAACVVDTHEFEECARLAAGLSAEGNPTALHDMLCRGVDLYRGEFLPANYDDWVLAPRERFQQTFRHLAARLSDLQETLRDVEGAVQTAQRLLRDDPLHEETVRRLMRLHALAGDRGAALRVYHTAASLLQRELGVQPAAATREAYERLLRQAPVRAVQPAARAAPPLVGRERAWIDLQRAWRAAAAGWPQVVIIRGEAGIGKTRLSEELANWVERQGLPVLRAACYAADRGLAFAPVATWLRERAAQGELADVDATWLSEIARLLPELLVARSDLPRPLPLTQNWQQQHFFTALMHALPSGKHPHLLLLDDLHWCDRDTLAWLHFLLQWRGATARLLVVTLRAHDTAPVQAEPAGDLSSWLAAIARFQGSTEIELDRLNPDETTNLAVHVAGRPLPTESAQHLYRETEGNPLFIVETIRAGVDAEKWPLPGDSVSSGATMPPRVHAVVAARLAQVTPPARELAGLAAVIGRQFTIPLLARAGGLDEDDLVESLDELWRRRIIREQAADAYDFTHGKLAQAAYAQLSPLRRRLLHRRVAEALLAQNPQTANDAALAGQIARHFERAGLTDQAVPYYQQAAAAAQRSYAGQVAQVMYEHLLQPGLVEHLDSTTFCEVLCRLGDVHTLAGRWTEAEQCYADAIGRGREAAVPGAMALGEAALGQLLTRKGAYERARPLLESACRHYTASGDRLGLSEATGYLGRLLYDTGELDTALACYEQQLAITEALDHGPGTSAALGNMGLVFWTRGDYDRALALYRRKLSLAHALGDREGLGMAVANMAFIYKDVGDEVQALRCYLTQIYLALELGHRLGLCLGLINLAIDSARRDVALATRLFELGQRLAEAMGSDYLLMSVLHNKAAMLARTAAQEIGVTAAATLERAYQLNEQALNLVPGRHDIVLPGTLLQIRLRVLSGHTPVAQGIEEMASLLDEYVDPIARAPIQFEIWRLDPTQNTHRQAAAAHYRALYAATPNALYRERYTTLTGDDLPDPPPLPSLPLDDLPSVPDLDLLLIRVERLAAEAV